MSDIQWLSTKEASQRLGVNLRTLYRFIDEGDLPAYKFGRVIRLRTGDIDEFVAGARITPGSLEHLYPEPARAESSHSGHHGGESGHLQGASGHLRGELVRRAAAG